MHIATIQNAQNYTATQRYRRELVEAFEPQDDFDEVVRDAALEQLDATIAFAEEHIAIAGHQQDPVAEADRAFQRAEAECQAAKVAAHDGAPTDPEEAREAFLRYETARVLCRGLRRRVQAARAQFGAPLARINAYAKGQGDDEAEQDTAAIAARYMRPDGQDSALSLAREQGQKCASIEQAARWLIAERYLADKVLPKKIERANGARVASYASGYREEERSIEAVEALFAHRRTAAAKVIERKIEDAQALLGGTAA